MKKEVTVSMSSVEATPIAHLVQLANQFKSRVYLEMNEKRVNGKSIMGMMSLVLTTGSVVTVSTEGEDEAEACEAIARFLSE